MRDIQHEETCSFGTLKESLRTASDAVVDLSYEECCAARALVRSLQLKVIRGVAERFDAADEDGFADLVQVAVGLFPDQRQAARELGASVSTINRWKNGTTIPHALVRVSIKGAILRLLDADASNIPTLFDFRPPEDRAVARTLAH